MSKRSRSSRLPTDDWAQLRLLCAEPAQEAYELIRPVVLFGRSAAQRANETASSARTIARKVQRFVTPEPDHQHLKDVALLHLFETSFPSPQLMLWEPDTVDWRLAIARPALIRRRRRLLPEVMQLSFETTGVRSSAQRVS